MVAVPISFVPISFDPISFDGDGKPKGNCDADLVLQVARDTYENKFDTTVIISSDGDYSSLVKFLMERKKLKIILSPHTKNLCSILLKRTNAPIAYLNDQRSILQVQKEKAPNADGTA